MLILQMTVGIMIGSLSVSAHWTPSQQVFEDAAACNWAASQEGQAFFQATQWWQALSPWHLSLFVWYRCKYIETETKPG